MLDLPVRAGVRHGGPIDADVVFIVELEELCPSELHVVVRDNGFWDSKAMDDVKEEHTACSKLIAEVGREDTLGTVDHEEWHVAGGPAGVVLWL